jgi:MFS family permease
MNKAKSGPRFHYGYVIAAACFFMMVLGWGLFYIYGVFFNPLSQEFGWSRAVTSGAFSISVLVSGVLGIIAGRISDRTGPKAVLMVCAVILALGYALMAVMHNVYEFYLIYGIVIATGVGGFWSPVISTVARWFVGRRGLMTGIVSGGISFGALILPPVVTQLITVFDWRITYAIIGGFVLIVVMVAAQFLKPNPQAMGLKAYGEVHSRLQTFHKNSPGFTFDEAVRTRQFWMVAVIYLCFGVVQLTIMVHIVPHLTGSGFSAITAAGILSTIGGVSFAGRIIMGMITDRIRVKFSAVVSLGLLTVSLLGLLWANDLGRLYAFAVIFGFGYGGLSCLQALISAELFGLGALGVITAMFSFSFNIGGAAGPVIAGYIFDVSESYRWAFLGCFVVIAIALAISLALSPPKKQLGKI